MGGVEHEIDEFLEGYLNTYAEIMPKRFKKWLAYYYPDARIRKRYLSYVNVDMANGTFANYGFKSDATSKAEIKIGKNVSIAPNVTFITKSEPNNSEYLMSLPEIKDRLIKELPIIVEDDVWIGAGVTILPGVRLKRCSIIGAGAIVVEDTEPYGIYAGVPARLLRKVKPVEE